MKFEKFELDLMKRVAKEEEINYKMLKKSVVELLKNEQQQKQAELSKIKNIYELNENDVKLLRKDVCLGSIFISDYENRFGIDSRIMCKIMQGFEEEIEYLADEYGGDDDDYDNPQELYNYIYSIEFDEETLNEMTRKAKEDIENEYNLREEIFEMEEIYNIARCLQWEMLQKIA